MFSRLSGRIALLACLAIFAREALPAEEVRAQGPVSTSEADEEGPGYGGLTREALTQLYFAYIEAEEARLEGDSAKVLAALDKIKVLRPQSAYVVTQIAEARFEKGDYVESATAAKEAIDLDPNQVDARLLLARIDERSNRSAESEAGLRKVLEIDPRNATALGMLGVILAKRGEHREAADMFLRLSFVLPNQLDRYHYLAALSYMQLKDYERAVDLLEKAIGANPYNYQAYRVLGQAYEGLSRWDEAARAYRNMIDLVGKEDGFLFGNEIAFAHQHLGEIYYRLGETALAEEELKWVIENSPGTLGPRRQMGIISFGHGDYESAVKYLTEWTDRYPSDVSTIYFLGRSYVQRGKEKERIEAGSGKSDLESAARQFRKILSVEPDHAGALGGLQEVLPPESSTEVLVHYNKAIESIRSATKDAEASPPTLLKMARMQLQKAKAAEAYKLPEVAESSRNAAISQLRQILSEDPKHLDALENLTEIYWDARDWDLARESGGKILGIDPENTWALHIRAMAAIQLEQYREAADDLEQSLAIAEKGGRAPDPSDYYYLGVAYSMLKNEEGALKAFQKGLEILPGQEDFAYQSSGLLIRQRRYGDAALLLRKALETNPKSADLIARLAFALQKDGKNQEAEDLLSKALRESPDDPALVIRMSSLLAETGRSAEAVTVLNDAIGKDSENTDLYLQLATVQEKEKNVEGVEDAIRRLLEKSPDNPVALNFLGYTYADMNIKLDQAYEMIQRAVAAEPKNSMFLDSLGWVYYRRGEFDKARESLEQAVNLPGGNDPVIFEHLGDVYRALNRKTDALNYLKKALDAAEEKEALSKKIEALEKEKQ